MESIRTDLLDTTNINEKVYRLLKRRIIDLSHPPGHKINIRQMAKDLGVSPTPIKDALIRLASEGWIEISARRGTYVKPLSYRDIAEVMDIMILLETGVLDMVGNRITPEQMENLERCYREVPMEDDDVDYVTFMEKITELHREIIRLTGNKTLLDMFDRLNTHNRILRYRFARKVWKRPVRYHQDYMDIIAALKEKEIEKAKIAIKEHFLSMNRFFLEKVAEAEV